MACFLRNYFTSYIPTITILQHHLLPMTTTNQNFCFNSNSGTKNTRKHIKIVSQTTQSKEKKKRKKKKNWKWFRILKRSSDYKQKITRTITAIVTATATLTNRAWQTTIIRRHITLTNRLTDERTDRYHSKYIDNQTTAQTKQPNNVTSVWIEKNDGMNEWINEWRIVWGNIIGKHFSTLGGCPERWQLFVCNAKSKDKKKWNWNGISFGV